MATKKSPDGFKLVANNRKARHDYEFFETYEAGIALQGTEIKSIRQAGKVNIGQAFITVRNGEAWLINANIAEYEFGNRQNHEPTRQRKLLLNKREIDKIADRLQTKGTTCVPVRMYLKRGLAKLEIATARGKKQFDKRQDVAKRDAKRQIDRAVKEARY